MNTRETVEDYMDKIHAEITITKHDIIEDAGLFGDDFAFKKAQYDPQQPAQIEAIKLNSIKLRMLDDAHEMLANIMHTILQEEK